MKNLPAERTEGELSIRDKNDPRSLVNLVPTNIAKLIEVMPVSILEMDDRALKRQVQPDVVVERVKLAFWNEYHLAQAKNAKMMMTNVYGVVGISQQLFTKIMSNSFTLAYIITPPADVSLQLEETMHRGLEQLRSILEMPHINSKGELDARAADVKFKITQDLINRVKGQVIQRVEVKSQNLNVNADVTATGSLPPPKSMTELDERLKQLQAKAAGMDIKELEDASKAKTSGEEENEIVIEPDED